MPLQPPPKKKAPAPPLQAGPVTASTPSPAPTSAHTPGPPTAPPTSTNTPSTPALPHSSSPPASRSPKGKIPKPKQGVAPTPKRRPSKAPPPAIRAESPATPSNNSSAKRPREEDDHVVDVEAPSPRNVSNEPSPPQRVKPDWENPPSEELKKRAEEVKAESADDANSFFEQMSELFKKENGGQESTLPADLSETLRMLLRSCGSLPEASDNPLVFSDPVTGRESPPASAGSFEEFIDYSFGQDNQLDDEEGSKAHTPELVSSSTNLSPESNTDGDNSLLATIATSVSDVKKEDHQDLRLGLWKEFDGGESAYYQPFEWKWDSPMPVLEQSWAVSTS
jgi:hypothetical protein